MKKEIGSAVAVIFLFIALALNANADARKAGDGFDFTKWGNALKEDATQDNANEKKGYSESGICVYGENAIVLTDDVEKTAVFFEAAGEEKEDAKQDAIDYLKEYEAMYAKANEMGYSATEEEVNTYINEMKETLNSSGLDEESKNQTMAIIAQFDSEEQYWTYEKEIYKKQLPIEKMVADMEADFFSGKPEANEEDWEAYFLEYKNALVTEENYRE